MAESTPPEADRISSDEPVTLWFRAMADGDDQAAERLWNHFFDRLTRIARRHLANRRAADEEDITASVFHRLYTAASQGRISEVRDRDDLWRLLFTMTVRRSIDANRRAGALRRGGGRVRGDSVFQTPDGQQRGWDVISSGELTPEFLTLVDERFRELLDQLPEDRLREIAVWRLEGWSNQEIAERLQVTVRSVERKLQRIRDSWSHADPNR